MKKTIHIGEAPKDPVPYTPAVEAGPYIFISGQIAQITGTRTLRIENIVEETTLVMENLGRILEAAGLTYDHLVKCTVYTTKMQYYAEISRIYQTYFKGDVPAREMVGVKELPRGVNLEISGIAMR
ncbi:MAG: RidA family protein [Flavobacteriales bacterium]|nr:RidA family protein [Flavobacteriales bacterium]